MLHKLRSAGRRMRLYRLPKTLLLNNIVLQKSELKRVLTENQVERDWYGAVPGYQSLAEIVAATATGRLAAITPTTDYKPIMRLLNPKLAEMYPGYLTPGAKALLAEIAERWRLAMNEAGLEPEIKLAITSLVRTQTYQDTIVKAGKLADPQSVHTRGEALDIDGSGYYLSETPINARQSRQKEYATAFRELDAEQAAPEYGDYELYNPAVHQLLSEVLAAMQAEGQLHFITEYAGTTNQCFHICRNPQYNKEQR